MNTKLPPPGCYWGGATQPYWHPGENPTADMLLFRQAAEPELLLIRRALNVQAAPGKWAFPGGFVDTHAPFGVPWAADVETPRAAALRELEEEAGLVLTPAAQARLVHIDIGRPGDDVRNNREAWTRKNIFAVVAQPEEILTTATSATENDTDRVQWFPLAKALGMQLAFDHSRILQIACAKLGVKTPETILR